MTFKKSYLIGIVVFSIALSTFTLYVFQITRTPNLQVDKDPAIIVIPAEATFRSVQDTLFYRHIVNDPVSFSFIAKLMGYQKAIKPGTYKIKSDMNNVDAVKMLRSGNQVPVYIRFSHARLVDELYEPVTRNLSMTPEAFASALESFIKNNDEHFNKDNIISMFIPNSYQVYSTISPEGLVKKMNQEYHRFWNEDRSNAAKTIGLTRFEVSTLASIVQAETVISDESPVIAGLYLNRLKRNIPLQADPTLVFASGDFNTKRVLNVHKEVDSPYNTYKHTGLPPGPINMPSIHSIDAVLHPDSNNYLYMCAKEDFSGYHNFTASLTQHLINASKYQRQLSIEQRKARLFKK